MRILPVTAAFDHIVRSAINNLRFAFHVAWPWLVILVPVNIAVSLAAPFDPVAGLNSRGILLTILAGLLSLFVFSSIAVNWHRYILKDELPMGATRLRTDGLVWRYFGTTLLIMLMLLLALLPFAFLLELLARALGQAALLIVVPAYVALLLAGLAAFYRLSIRLPAIALGRTDYRFKDAWAESQGNSWQLVGLGLLLFLVMIVVALVFGVMMTLLAKFPGGVVGQIAGAIVETGANWLVSILAVTALTSLYGFFSESRNF